MTSGVSILFMVFNRPDVTAQVFERIRQARPAKLFVSADGPRANRPEDSAACAESRTVATQVDWPCEVKTLFRDANIGCRRAVSEGITWFFQHVEQGIILEDDTLMHPSFFPFCAEMLDRYKHDTRVMAIAAECCGDSQSWAAGESYGFSACPLIWGWATWRRAWAHYDADLSDLNEPGTLPWLRRHLGSQEVYDYWLRRLQDVRSGRVDTWDFQWLFATWINSGLCILPSTNLVTNIGCDERATHTTSPTWKMANRPTEALAFPLRHPRHVARNFELERALEVHRFAIRSPSRRLEALGASLDPWANRAIKKLKKFRNRWT